MYHEFSGKWITDSEFAAAVPRNVFHRQLQPLDLTPDAHPNRHILFRRRFTLPEPPRRARLYITADDYYKLYLNGTFVAQGPAPSYPFRCGYNEIDVTPYLRQGENVLAVHTLYQGLINRVWVSGDDRHGLLCDLECDGRLRDARVERYPLFARFVGCVGQQVERRTGEYAQEQQFDADQYRELYGIDRVFGRNIALCHGAVRIQQVALQLESGRTVKDFRLQVDRPQRHLCHDAQLVAEVIAFREFVPVHALHFQRLGLDTGFDAEADRTQGLGVGCGQNSQ